MGMAVCRNEGHTGSEDTPTLTMRVGQMRNEGLRVMLMSRGRRDACIVSTRQRLQHFVQNTGVTWVPLGQVSYREFYSIDKLKM